MRGHYWTIWPHLRDTTWHRRARGGELDWSCLGAECGVPATAARLRGRWTWPRGGRTHDAAILLLHGLGGDPGSPYCRGLAVGLARRGHAVLNLAMRGVDADGEDFYHGGLAADPAMAVAALRREGFERVTVVGFSVGGHVALRLAATLADPAELGGGARPDRVVAVCPPIELGVAGAFIDQKAAKVYLRNVLSGLLRHYSRVAARRPDFAPTPVAVMRRLTTIRAWDEHTVVPRFGFADADEYYRRESVAPRLANGMVVPTLFVAARHDPIVPAAVVEPYLPERVPGLKVRWAARGGHLGFPVRLDLGLGPDRGLAGQIAGWLDRAP